MEENKENIFLSNDFYDTIENIVNDCMSTHDGKRTLELPTKNIPTEAFVIENSLEEEYLDEHKIFKDYFTKYVVEELFINKKGLYNFLYIINNIFTYALQYYCSLKNIDDTEILFIFKGGNVLRTVVNEFKLFIPGNTNRILEDFYGEYFKRSDADFGILINPDIANYENVFDDVSFISYLLLQIITDIIRNKKESFFEWFKYNDEYKQILLKKYLSSIDDIDLSENTFWSDKEITDISFIDVSAKNQENKYKGQNNLIIRNEQRYDYTTPTYIWYQGEKKDFMYNSYNESVHIETEEDVIKFNLIRTKINFNLFYKMDNTVKLKNIGGELIDVSISHRDDTNYVKFYKNIKKYIANYSLCKDCQGNYKNKESVNNFSFKSYSLIYLFSDLYKILFIISDYPWDDEKYIKRINRMFYIGFIDLIDFYKNIKQRYFYLNTFLEIIEQIKNTLENKKNNKLVIENQFQKITALFEEINIDSIFFHILIKSIIEIYKKKFKNKQTESNKKSLTPHLSFEDEYHDNLQLEQNKYQKKNTKKIKKMSKEEEFLSICSDNLYILIKSLDDMKDFCDYS